MNFRHAALVLALMFALCSCTRADDEHDALLDRIPANARVVATGNLYDCASMLGMRLSGGELRPAEAMDQLGSAWPSLAVPLSAIARWQRHADLAHMAVMVDSATQQLLITALRLDQEAPADLEGEDLETAMLPEATLYTYHGAWVVATPHRLWAGNLDLHKGKKGRRPELEFNPAALDSALAAAAREPIASAPGVGPFLKHADALRLCVDMRSVPMPSGEPAARALVAPKADAHSITARVTYIDAQGRKADPFANLSPIDENVYSYLPAATAAVGAVGADRHTLRSMLSHYGRALPMRIRAAVEVASGFLCDTAATTAVALIPGGSAETIRRFSPDTWTILALAPIEIGRTEEFFELIDELGRGDAQCDIAGQYIAISNGPLDDVASGDDIGEQLSPSRLRLQAVVPYNSELMRALGLNRGLSLEVDCAGGVTTARLSFLGDDGAPASVLSALAAKMLK